MDQFFFLILAFVKRWAVPRGPVLQGYAPGFGGHAKWGIYLLGAGCIGESGMSLGRGRPIVLLKSSANDRLSYDIGGVHLLAIVQEIMWLGAK